MLPPGMATLLAGFDETEFLGDSFEVAGLAGIRDQSGDVGREGSAFLRVLLDDHFEYLGQFGLGLGRGLTHRMASGDCGHIRDKRPIVVGTNHDRVLMEFMHLKPAAILSYRGAETQ